METIVKVKNLSEYINVMTENYYSGECIYRGENQKYDSISSSLIRAFGSNYNVTLDYVYNDMLSEFFREVGNDLSPQQTKFFLAFSQHHGLRTNLVDFTTSPLIALYFACEKSNYSSSNTTGYVYCIRSSSTVNATDMIDSISFQDLKFRSIFNSIANRERDAIKLFTSAMRDYQCIDYSISVMKECVENGSFDNCKRYLKEINQFKIDPDEFGIELEPKQMNIALKKRRAIVKKYAPEVISAQQNPAEEYVALLIMYLSEIRSRSAQCCATFPSVPYLLYRTPVKFDRIRSQSGIFIYQGYADSSELYGPNEITVQQIIPDITIEVKNQKHMIQELDLVGINRFSVFGDYDNAARYINYKYSTIEYSPFLYVGNRRSEI